MANRIVVNPLLTELTNVNAAGVDVPPQSQMTVDLTDAEAGTAVTAGAAILPAGSDYQERRQIARTIKYEKVA